MRRKKHSDRGGGGGGTELFICFTSRPSSASVAGGAAPSTLRPSSSSKLLSPGRGGGGTAGAGDAPAPPLHPSLSRRLRNSGSLKGGQSPMFPSGSTGGRRGRAGFEPAEPSSPKVTCIGQVRVKGGKRRPKHASAAALRSRSRRGGVGTGGSEASFRRSGDDRDGPQGKNQGWVYQIPVNICEALKTFGSCGGRSLCSPSRGGSGERGGALAVGVHGDKKRRRAPAGGSWLCGAAVARCLLAIQEDDDEEVGKGAAVVPAEEMRTSEVGLVMEGWDVEEEEEKGVVVGEVEVENKDEIFVVGKEEEGRVSVCIPPRNALLLMRCRSDPVRMAALATRFWGSPAAATVEQQVDNAAAASEDDGEEEDEGENEAEAVVDKECSDKARGSTVSVEDTKCREYGAETGEVDQAPAEVEAGPNCGDPVEVEKDGHCGAEGEDVQIVRRDAALEVSLGEAMGRENRDPATVDLLVDGKDEEGLPAAENVEEEVKGRRSICSSPPSIALKEEQRKLRRLSSRRRVSTSSRTSSVSDRVGRRHSFSAEMVGRRSSFSSLKDSRRASFSIDRDGRRWSFSIEQEHLVAEPKVLMSSRKGKSSSDEPEPEKDCAVVAAPNSAEEDQESHGDVKEEEVARNGEEDGAAQGEEELNREVEKVEAKGEEEPAAGQVQRRKKSGELPDCLLMMMYEPKLSMEVSKETWVCSTDFVHWKSYQGKSNRNRHQQKASASGDDAAAATEEPKEEDVKVPTAAAKNADEGKDEPAVSSAPKPPPHPAVQKATPPKPASSTEQKVKIELPLVAANAAAAYAPFVLKRCKSEPLRSSARLAPDACFWKERHRPLNAAGVGF